MAVEQKRKVGRPPKNKPVDPVVNEQVERIRMTEDKDDKKIVLTDIQQKWREILHTYSDRGLSMTQISSALSNAMLNNPFLQNQRLRRISSNASAKSKTDLQKALQSPQGNEQLFREESLFLSFTNYVYHSLLNLYRDIPLYNYYYTPKYVDKKDMNGDNFKKESKNKVEVIKFIINKRYGADYDKYKSLKALVSFYENYQKRSIVIKNIPENEFIYLGSDIRKFNKNLLNNNLSKLYDNFLDEMLVGFDEIKTTKKDYEKVVNITKFMCIYPFVKISIIKSGDNHE